MNTLQNRRLMTRIFGAAAIFCGLIAAPALVAGQQPYRVIDKWKIGGDGFWDYLTVDSTAHRLYVTHGPRVEVIDTTTGKPVGNIGGLHGTHGVALDDAGKFGYISDGGANAVVVFDRATLATVATIAVGTGPDGIAYEPATKTVWAFNGRSKNASVVDTVSRKLIATIPLPGKPEFPAADGTGIVYVNIENKNEIVRLDAHTNKVTGEWPLKGLESPSGLVIDTAEGRLFTVCDGKKMGVVDTKTGKLIATPAIGDGPDAAGWDPNHKVAFASSGDGILAVVDASTPAYKTIQTLTTEKGARTMAYDAATDRVYLAVAKQGPPPAPTASNPHPYPSIVAGSFAIIVVGK